MAPRNVHGSRYATRGADAAGSEIGKTRWEVPHLEAGRGGLARAPRPRSKPTCRSVISSSARPTPDGGNRYVRWPTNRRPPWTGAWTFAAPWSRSSRGSMHRGRIDRCCRMPSP